VTAAGRTGDRAPVINPPDRHDPELAPFWAGTEQDELRVQRCAACGAVRWPPRPACARCSSLETEWVRASGRGELFTWTVVARSTLPEFADQVPYAVGVVALADLPVRMIGRIETDDPWALQVGLPVTAVFRPHASGVRLAVWQP
jgi:uncharacterized OB-fold protein